MSLKILTLLNQLSFGNAEMKTAISQSPTALLITGYVSKQVNRVEVKMVEEGKSVDEGTLSSLALDPIRDYALLYAKCLKSFSVNSPAGRAQLNYPEVFVLISQILRLSGETGDKELFAELLTSICAISMNDEKNGELCEELVGMKAIKDGADLVFGLADEKGSAVEGKKEGKVDDEVKSDVIKKVAFLEALFK
jgi:hypothetical protein